jgi:hypothetical protein
MVLFGNYYCVIGIKVGFYYLFFSGCGKTLALEGVQQQVGGAVLLSATQASLETVPKHP